MKKLIYISFLLIFVDASSQSVFFKTGLNITSYDYTDAFNKTNNSIKASSGSFYEIGYTKQIKTGRRGSGRKYGPYSGMSISSSVSINQYNATGGNLIDSYVWKTNYLGWNNNLNYSLHSNKDFIDAGVKIGFGLSTIVNGTQLIGGQSLDLKINDEFNGLWVSPSIGLILKYDLYQDVVLSFGYDFSKIFSVKAPVNGESLSFNNNQISFGIIVYTD